MRILHYSRGDFALFLCDLHNERSAFMSRYFLREGLLKRHYYIIQFYSILQHFYSCRITIDMLQ